MKLFIERIRKRKILTRILISCLTVTLVVASVICFCSPAQSMTEREYNRFEELYNAGYSLEIIQDQLDEEFQGIDGANGTGGIDGKKLNGSSAGSQKGGNNTTSSDPTPAPTNKPAHVHSYEGKVVKEPTCVSEGEEVFTCACGDSYKKSIPALNHEYEVDETKHTEPTCKELGTDTFVCIYCGDSFVQPYGELGDHKYELAADSKEATCTEAGKLHYVCSVCGDEYVEEQEALGHDWSKEYTIEKSATCTEDGMKDIRCTRCGEVKPGSEVAIPKMGHLENPEHEIIEATLLKDGVERVTCMRCGEIISETVLPRKLSLPALIGICGAGLLILIAAAVVIIKGAKKRKE